MLDRILRGITPIIVWGFFIALFVIEVVPYDIEVSNFYLAALIVMVMTYLVDRIDARI